MAAKKEEKKESKIVRNTLIKILISLILFLSFLIGIKQSENFKTKIYENVYEKSMFFAGINSWYNKTFGSILPVKNVFDNDVMVFDEKPDYKAINKYKDGFLLELDNNLVPIIKDGIIIYIGEKEGYGKTVIVESDDKTNIWYSNMNFNNVNLYDYVKKNDYVGEAIDNKLILVFQRNGDYLDYKEFI